MSEKQKHKDGILGTLLSRAAQAGPFPEIPGVPALTAANVVLRYAAARRQAAQARPAAVPPPAVRRNAPIRTAAAVTVRTQGEQALARLNRNPVVRDIAGDAARTIALVPGAARGVWHTAEDIGHAAYLAHGYSPFTHLLPTAEAARREASSDAAAIGQKLGEIWDDPREAVEDIKRAMKTWREGVDPTATPKAETATGEWRRQFPIGLNQGELALDALSTVVAGPALKMARASKLAKALSTGRRAAARPRTLGPWSPTAADYRARGVPDGMAEYFAEPYVKGMGSHLWGRNRKLPEILGGGNLPPVLLESRFNVLKPEGWTKGEFYERHVNVDGQYHGGKVPARHGGSGWSGDALGWERYGPLRSFWYGAPGPLKAAIITPLAAGAGAAVDYFDGEEDGG